jgi:hypothetical protein
MTRFALALFLCSGTIAMAQVGGGFGRVPGAPLGGGFGSIMFPGTGVPRGNPNISASPHIDNLNRSIRGAPPVGRPGGAVVLPVPILVGGFGYGYGYAPAPAAPNVTVINAPQPSPTVIINQSYTPDQAKPVMRTYPDGSLEPAESNGVSSYQAPIPSHPEPVRAKQPARSVHSDKPTVYLIALRDGTVYSAYAYWVDGDTLHYVTTKHALNMASLALVDTALTAQLNDERGVSINLGGR